MSGVLCYNIVMTSSIEERGEESEQAKLEKIFAIHAAEKNK